MLTEEIGDDAENNTAVASVSSNNHRHIVPQQHVKSYQYYRCHFTLHSMCVQLIHVIFYMHNPALVLQTKLDKADAIYGCSHRYTLYMA